MGYDGDHDSHHDVIVAQYSTKYSYFDYNSNSTQVAPRTEKKSILNKTVKIRNRKQLRNAGKYMFNINEHY